MSDNEAQKLLVDIGTLTEWANNPRNISEGDFVDYVLGKHNGTILPTEAGLLVART